MYIHFRLQFDRIPLSINLALYLIHEQKSLHSDWSDERGRDNKSCIVPLTFHTNLADFWLSLHFLWMNKTKWGKMSYNFDG